MTQKPGLLSKSTNEMIDFSLPPLTKPAITTKEFWLYPITRIFSSFKSYIFMPIRMYNYLKKAKVFVLLACLTLRNPFLRREISKTKLSKPTRSLTNTEPLDRSRNLKKLQAASTFK